MTVEESRQNQMILEKVTRCGAGERFKITDEMGLIIIVVLMGQGCEGARLIVKQQLECRVKPDQSR